MTSGIIDPGIAEVVACREALALAENLLLQRIIIACNAQSVVAAIDQNQGGNFEAMIKEINLRRLRFKECQFVYEGRASNIDAHNTAKFACNLPPGCHLWLPNPHDPNCIEPVIVFEQ